ncbi:MAG TPA: hypothetical protein VGT99_05815 [Gammaproteobacteria bacterium]|nr:hypothetical protein [Gammaproteobacteria bacterium]
MHTAIQMKSKLLVLALSLAVISPAWAADGKAPYPNMAPIEQYRSASQADEIALARSAAPASISGKAEILTLGAHGYETAVKGTNGFVCLVSRSWDDDFDDPEFWNPKMRGPMCLNPAAVRTILPSYLKRTEWVLSGVPIAEMLQRTKAAIIAKEITAPEGGAMCYMMSKGGYLGDDAGGHWHPHVMFYLPPTDAAQLGARLPGSPIAAASSDLEPVTIFMVVVPKWSDGTPAEYSAH